MFTRFLSLALLALTFSTSVFAMENSSSRLEDLLRDKNLHVAVPAVRLNHEYGALRASVLNVCLTEKQLGLKAVFAKVCTKVINANRGAPSCLKKAVVEPTSPALVTRTYCTKWVNQNGRGPAHCVKTETHTTDYSLPLQVNVYERNERSEVLRGPRKDEKLLFTVAYQIPACVK